MSLVRSETKWNIFGYEVQWESDCDQDDLLMEFLTEEVKLDWRLEDEESHSWGIERERTRVRLRIGEKGIQSNQREISPQSTFTLLSIPDDIFLCGFKNDSFFIIQNTF